jgi:hypothetical protein
MTCPSIDRRAGKIGVVLRAISVWLLVLGLGGSNALATQVYYSPNDDGVPAGGSPTLDVGGVRSVFLYIDGGATASQPGAACHVGQGDEVCGFSLTLTGQTGLTLAGFNPDGGADLLHDSNALELRVNGLDTASPTPGPKRIGELLVNAVAGGALELSAGEVVGAALASENLATSTVVTVPEPGGLVQLLSGVALLLGIGRRRARS